MASSEGEHSFKYTFNTVHITHPQRQFYEDNGYLIFRKLVDDDLLDECQQRFVDICSKKVKSPGNVILMKDLFLDKAKATGEHLYYKVNDILHDDIMFKYASYTPIIDIISSIIGPDITAFHSMFINKPPGSTMDDSRHPLHQDLHFFPFRPSEKIAAVWTAMQTIDETNGALFAIPGSHKWGLYPHDYPVNVRNKGYHGVFGFDQIPRVNFPMKKGDSIFFHPLLLHGSGPNLTSGFRRAISVHFADTNCEFVDCKGTTQENASRVVADIYKLKGITLAIPDIWRYKSRLIKGRPGNFQRFGGRL